MIVGLFSYSHMEFDADRDPGPSGDPSLAEMADTAVRVLQRNPNGFFLLVESKCNTTQNSEKSNLWNLEQEPLRR